MNVVSGSQTSIEIQLTMFDAIKNLLRIEPVLLLGILLIAVLLIVIFVRDSSIPKVKTSIGSIALYYYLCIMLTHIVGIPTLAEWIRLTQVGEAIFNPNINLIPLADGFSLSFILNIFLFIPLGFLCPLISRTFERGRNVFFIGLGLSLMIEISQLFTLFRASDVNDLLTNILGAMLGYICFRLAAMLRIVKMHSRQQAAQRDFTAYIPLLVLVIAFIFVFLSPEL